MPKSAHLRVQKVMTLNSPCFFRSYPNCMYEQENKRNSITHTHFKTQLLVHFSLDAVGHCSCHKCFTKWMVLVTVKTLLQKGNNFTFYTGETFTNFDRKEEIVSTIRKSPQIVCDATVDKTPATTSNGDHPSQPYT